MPNYIWIPLIASIVAFIIIYRHDGKPYGFEWMGMTLASVLLGVLSGGFIMVVLLTFLPVNTYDTYSYTQNIYSLERGSTVKGQFFLGSGVIEGKQMYYYFEQNGEGYMLGQTEAKGLQMVERDETPHIEVWKWRKIYTFEKWLNGTWFGTVPEDSVESSSNFYVKKIVIPKGTIIQQYKVN
jgi:hypothetical protein